MGFNLVSYREMPPRLRINGLIHKREYVYPPRRATKAEGFDLPVQDHGYLCYGTRPRAMELRDYGLWLQNEAPFFFEVEMEVFAMREEPLPKQVILADRKFTLAFDRYYLGPEFTEKQIKFVFDYMAPTYDADIDLKMNIGVNGKLLEGIAEVIPEPSGTVKVLDYGVGTGLCATAQPQVKEGKHYHWQITGLDISPFMLREARKRLNSENSEYHLYKAKEVKDAILSEEEASFDAAMSCFTVHYFLDLKPYENIHYFLKPGRPFVCNVFQNEILKTEDRAKQVGFSLVGDRHTLEYEVKEQPVVILTFIKRQELSP